MKQEVTRAASRSRRGGDFLLEQSPAAFNAFCRRLKVKHLLAARGRSTENVGGGPTVRDGVETVGWA